MEDAELADAIATNGAGGRSGGTSAAAAAGLGEVGVVVTGVALEASVDCSSSGSVVEASRRARRRRGSSSWAVVSNRADVTLVDVDGDGVASVGSTKANVTSGARFAPERVGRPEAGGARDARVLGVVAKNGVVA